MFPALQWLLYAPSLATVTLGVLNARAQGDSLYNLLTVPRWHPGYRPFIHWIGALRVAAVRVYPAQAQPLPFIADDMLVLFGDARTAAAITFLTDLGNSTQPILLTQHDHIMVLADRPEGVAVQSPPAVAFNAVPALVGV